MLSSQILQSTIDGLKNITRREFSVLEREGKVVASTEADKVNKQIDTVPEFVSSAAESQLIKKYQYFKVLDNGVTEYVILIKGEDEETYRIGKIAAFQIQGLIHAYKERFDRDNFIKNLLLDNLLLVDIYGRASKLRIDNNMRRAVYLIEARSDEGKGTVEIVRNLFPSKHKDFVSVVDQDHIILTKEFKDKDTIETVEKHAKLICTALAVGEESPIRVGIGTVVNDLKFVSRSYKEAKMALEVGKIFEDNRTYLNYETLGIGRLIYQLPMSLCQMFTNEVLQGISADSFDEETLSTVDNFFENSLNVSETARKLFIHRNTLVYRLDKLQKMTGLDLRSFDDAIIFKIMLMVSSYMKYKEIE